MDMGMMMDMMMDMGMDIDTTPLLVTTESVLSHE